MGKRNDEWQDELGKELARAGGQLARGLATYLASKVEAEGLRAGERVREQQARREAQQRSKLERRLARRRQRREEKYGLTSPIQGWMQLVLAAAVLAVVFVMPNLWWLVFVALAFAMRGANVLGYHAVRRRSQHEAASPPPVAAAVDPRRARVDEICNRLLASLKDAPDNVRTFLSKPEETVESLRKTCHDLLTREQALRALASPEEDARLVGERASLSARIDAEADAETRSRLSSARDALDERRRQAVEIGRHASRLEAEHTRLTYTLDGLYAQVMRMRTAGVPTDAGEGLKLSLQQLREEVGALADALEAANAAPVSLPEGLGPRSFEAPSRPGAGRVRE